MIGLVHTILFDLIERQAGASGVATVRARAGVPADRDYRLNAAYDDAEWHRLLAATCSLLAISPDTAEEALAAHFFRDALERWPMWFRMSRDSRSFLMRQPAIHNSLAAGLGSAEERQAVEDKFRAEADGEDLVVTYHSTNRHCRLYRRLAALIIEHYGDKAEITETACQRAGAPVCTIRIHWTSAGGQSQ